MNKSMKIENVKDSENEVLRFVQDLVNKHDDCDNSN